MAGLDSGAGVGLVVLFKANPSVKQNLFITGLLLSLIHIYPGALLQHHAGLGGAGGSG